MNSVVGWVLTAIVVNYVLHAITGYPLIWMAMCQAAKPLSTYVTIANLAMAAGIVGAGLWNGLGAAAKMATLLFGFNLVPLVLQAIMSFGVRCG